jgi:hypothetical protein
MRATRRERYSPFSGCRTTLHCWDGIGFESLEGVSPATGNRTRTHSLWTWTAAPWLSGVPGRITR